MKRLLAVLTLVLIAATASAQPNLGYSFARDGEGRPIIGRGLRPTVTAQMGIPIGTPFFDTSTNALYYWSGSAWTSPDVAGATFTSPISVPLGSISVPSITPVGDTDTGVWFQAATINFSVDGTKSLAIGNGFISLPGNASIVYFGSSLDAAIQRKGAGQLQLGENAATATNQILQAASSTGSGIAGGNLTVRAGAGTTGTAAGGNIYLVGGANAGAGEPGGVIVVDNGAKPTCAVGIRGMLWYEQGGAGVADTFEICAKQAAGDTYAWRVAATIP